MIYAKYLPWLVVLALGVVIGGLTTRLDAEVKFSNGVLESINILGNQCK